MDPDGESPNIPFMSPDEFWNFLIGASSGADKTSAKVFAAANGHEASKIQLNALSSYMGEIMAGASDKAILGGMQFTAENGTTLALVAYATGNIEIGAVIDGITVYCDVTLAYKEACETKDYKKFAKTVAVDIVSTAVGNGVGTKAAKSCSKLIEGIPDSLTSKAIDSMANILGEYAGSVAGEATKGVADKIID